MKTSVTFCFLVVFSFHLNLKAQDTQAFEFVTWPHSVSSFGTGEMGVASLTNDDALVYNPAKLTLTNNTKFSFYRNPFQLVIYVPISSYTLYHNVPNVGSFALNYENQDYGEFRGTIIDPSNPQGYVETGMIHVYQNSFAAGYAKNFSENFSAGIQFRYSYWHFREVVAEGFLVSLGGFYNPDFCSRLTLGFSLMNLGPAVKFESEQFINGAHYDPPPARLNLGINFTAAENNYFTLPLSLGIWKPFDERNDDGEGQSSFKTVFTDWSDFPNDLSLQTGLSFIWKPLYFNDNFAFFQEFYAGNISTGIKTNIQNFYTHGLNTGLEFYGYKFTAGYAGVAHNVHYPNYLQWTFPYETFQLSFEVNDDLLFKRNTSQESKPLLKHIILSLGLGQTVRFGKAKSHTVEVFKYSAEDNLNYNFECAFYFNDNNALLSSISYNRIFFDISYASLKLIESKFETFSFFSSYRYHLLENFHPLFLQGGLGVIRINPVVKSSPRYDYKTAVQAAAGLTLDYLDPLIITPVIDYNFILNFTAYPPVSDAPRILGYNQFNFNLKFGYKIF
jgi:hypothetical protein